MMLVALIIMVATPNLFAAWKVVIDKNCIKVVSSNLASQKLIEGQHNQRLDSIAEKKKKVELYTVSMATIKELYKVTMQNVSGFGTESKYYKEIGLCAYDILKDVPELIKTINKAKFSNKLLCLNELGNLVTETQQLVGNFVNIVNNTTVQNPLKGQGTAEKKDGSQYEPSSYSQNAAEFSSPNRDDDSLSHNDSSYAAAPILGPPGVIHVIVSNML